MPPIAITFHTRPTSHRFAGGVSGAKQPLYYSVDSRKSNPTPSAPPQPPIIPAVVPETTSTGSTSSTSTTPVPPSARRKSTAVRAPSASTPGYITLTPLNSAILDRCLLVHTSAPTQASPKKAGSKSAPSPAPIHPYSRLSDLGNDRSPNPSPREILRAQRAEAEKARNKKDSVAAARAAIAAKKKPKKANGRGSKSTGATPANRSPSPSNEVRGLLGLGGSGLRQEVLPIILTEQATPEASPLPTPSSRSLKRTRSAGIPPLSTGVANALGASNLGIGSPLKAVIGANDEEEGDHRTKRSRTHEPPVGKQPVGPSGLGAGRKKSHSPKGTTTGTLGDALPVPKSVPMPSSEKLGTTRASGRASSVVGGVGAAGGLGGLGAATGTGDGLGGTSMRRAVSAAGGESGRRDSMTSQTSEGVAAVRARREVNLPRALRDYETRPGTMV